MPKFLRVPVLVVPVLVVAVVGLAACSSSGSSKAATTSAPTSTSAASTTTQEPSGGITTAKGIRLFLACMTSRGVNFPKSGPGSGGLPSPSQLPAAVRNGPKFLAAFPVCRPDLTKFGGVTATTGAG